MNGTKKHPVCEYVLAGHRPQSRADSNCRLSIRTQDTDPLSDPQSHGQAKGKVQGCTVVVPLCVQNLNGGPTVTAKGYPIGLELAPSKPLGLHGDSGHLEPLPFKRAVHGLKNLLASWYGEALETKNSVAAPFCSRRASWRS